MQGNPQPKTKGKHAVKMELEEKTTSVNAGDYLALPMNLAFPVILLGRIWLGAAVASLQAR